MTLVYIAEATRNPSLASFVAPAGVWANPGNQSRAEILKQLGANSGKHLVIVRYSTGNTEGGEWVYNRADIDSAKVVWAREIPGVEIQPLLKYFSSYHIWLLEPPNLTPFNDTFSHRVPSAGSNFAEKKWHRQAQLANCSAAEIQKSSITLITAIWPHKQKAKNHYFHESFSPGPSHGMATTFWAFVKDFRKNVHRDSSPRLSRVQS